MLEMKNNPLISVIVPVYNVEKYIHRCVNSILNQTYKNLEIILVDDGSPDKCGGICDEYAKRDNRIRVVHKANGGLASARNSGLDIAQGDYIAFVDSDDWIAIDTYEYCLYLNTVNGDNADIIQFGIIEAKNEDVIVPKCKEITQKLKGKEILNYLMIKSTKTDSYFAVWRCIFKKKLFESERFPEGVINEDIVIKYRLLSKADIMIDSNIQKYYYFQSTGSLTTDGFKKSDFDLYTAASGLQELTREEAFGDISKLGEVKYARTSLSLLCKIAFYGFNDTTIDQATTIKELRNELRSNLKLLLMSPIPLSRKCCAILLSIHIKALSVPLRIWKRFIG